MRTLPPTLAKGMPNLESGALNQRDYEVDGHRLAEVPLQEVEAQVDESDVVEARWGQMVVPGVVSEADFVVAVAVDVDVDREGPGVVEEWEGFGAREVGDLGYGWFDGVVLSVLLWWREGVEVDLFAEFFWEGEEG